MKHFYITIILIFIAINAIGQTQFPYFNSLASSSTDITTFGNSDNTNAGYPKFSNSFLYLTPNINSRTGFAVFNSASFPSFNGIHIEFEFSANPNTGANGADGFSVFLFDANTNITSSNTGPAGGSFGYTLSGSNQGLQDAYLGIGFDEYGNFKAYESNKNGFPKTSSFMGGNDQNSFRNHITIRGASGKNFKSYNASSSSSYNDYYWGYPVLYTASTQNSGLTRYSAYLKTDATSQTNATSSSTSMIPGDANNQLYGYSTTPISSTNFTLGSTTLSTDSLSDNFRKAFIDITPVFNSSSTITGYNISVSVKHGTITEKMVNSFFYPVGNLKYVDNRSDVNSTGVGTVTSINTTPPTNFGLGFAASTGGSNNNHAIRNLYISIPKSASSNDDNTSICLNTNSSNLATTTLFPLSNDLAYNTQSVLSNDNVDPSSFRFNSDIATLMDSSSSATTNQNITTSNGVMSSVTTKNNAGTWTYTTSTKQLSYTRAANFKGIATVLYSITSSYTGLNNNTYRSKASTVSVALTGPRVTKDSTVTTLIAAVNGGTSTTSSQNVIANDTSFTYVSGNSALTTSGASPLNTSSFYFSSGDGSSNLGTTSTTNTFGNWAFANNQVSFTPSSSFSGVAKAFYRISTNDGCLSDVDTVIFNYPYSLPVQYSQELTATLKNSSNILLNWTTGVEVNNKHFTILRSTDAATWDSIGVVNSQFSNGNGSNASYTFTDNTFSSGTNYYELKQVDLDGNVSYSRIVSILTNGSSNPIKLFPNPATNSITIQNIETGSTYKIISLDGKILSSGIFNNQEQTIDINTLPSGIYFVQILSKSSAKTNLRFIKK